MAECGCGNDENIVLLYSCSGAANTGLLADQVMRRLRDGGAGKSTCLAGIAAGLHGFVQSAESGAKNVVVDGCPVACGAKIFADKGLPFEHFVLTDYGVEKGKTAITESLIAEMADRLRGEI